MYYAPALSSVSKLDEVFIGRHRMLIVRSEDCIAQLTRGGKRESVHLAKQVSSNWQFEFEAGALYLFCDQHERRVSLTTASGCLLQHPASNQRLDVSMDYVSCDFRDAVDLVFVRHHLRHTYLAADMGTYVLEIESKVFKKAYVKNHSSECLDCRSLVNTQTF